MTGDVACMTVRLTENYILRFFEFLIILWLISHAKMEKANIQNGKRLILKLNHSLFAFEKG